MLEQQRCSLFIIKKCSGTLIVNSAHLKCKQIAALHEKPGALNCTEQERDEEGAFDPAQNKRTLAGTDGVPVNNVLPSVLALLLLVVCDTFLNGSLELECSFNAEVACNRIVDVRKECVRLIIEQGL